MSNLVLTRRKQESVIIYKEAPSPYMPSEIICEIFVTALGPKQVKLAFEADPSIKIDRKEIYDKK